MNDQHNTLAWLLDQYNNSENNLYLTINQDEKNQFERSIDKLSFPVNISL